MVISTYIYEKIKFCAINIKMISVKNFDEIKQKQPKQQNGKKKKTEKSPKKWKPNN